jgi:hypothetical protein
MRDWLRKNKKWILSGTGIAVLATLIAWRRSRRATRPDSLQKLRKDAIADAQSSFHELKAYVSGLDPIKLLTQLTLTFLFVPEDKFVEEGDETITWSRWIEFLAGCIVSNRYPAKPPAEHVDGTNLEKVATLLDKYFGGIRNSLLFSGHAQGDNIDHKMRGLLGSAKIYSLNVRGDTYPHKLFELADDLFSQHDHWFTQKLGFTINQAIQISKSITEEYSQRFNESKNGLKGRAKKFVDELLERGEGEERDREDLEKRAAVYLLFGRSDSLLCFTVDELTMFSGVSHNVCERYLERMSQTFGYRNVKFPDVFENPLAAPWDYNSLYERPIIAHEGRYFLPVPSLLPTVLFNTFHYDLITDLTYRETYNAKRGPWLEKRTADCFGKIFPPNEIFLNAKYKVGKKTEEVDVLVLHDRKIFIVQCKSKRLRYESEIGKDFEFIKDDLEKGIKESFDQGVKARNYIRDNAEPQFTNSEGDFLIDAAQVTDIFLVSVTLGNYQNLVTRLANINPALNLFSDNQYPWAVSLFDLEVVAELIDQPSTFIHYVSWRLQVEQTEFDLSGDELDLLGFYFSQGLFFETDEFKELNGVGLSGFSSEIDQYMFEKYERGGNPSKPKQKMPSNFDRYLEDIEKLPSAYKIDCALRLLDLSYPVREFLVNGMELAKAETKEDGGLHSLSTVIDKRSLGLSFVSMDAGGDLEKLYRQASAFAILKKYQTKCKEWVGLGWDRSSPKKVDVAVFLSYDWGNDPELDRLAKENLKEGRFEKAT